MARKLVAMLSAIVLACGLMPVSAVADEPIGEGGSSSLQLEPGTYVEHEAIAYVVGDDDGITPFSLGEDLLSDAEELMTIDAQAAVEALGDGAATGSEGASVSTLARASVLSSGDSARGRLVVVHEESLSTEEIIAKLEDDSRVVFAEPNAIVAESNPASDEALQGIVDELVASVDGSAFADGDYGTDGEAEPQSDGVEARNGDAELQGDEAGPQDGGTEPQDDGAEGQDDEDVAYFGQDAEGSMPDLNSFLWGFDNDGVLGGIDEDEAVDMRSAEWTSQTPDESLEEVVVAVIDSGVDASNPDLAPVMWDGGLTSGIELTGGEDEHGFAVAADSDAGVTSTTGIDNYHGTHVAGIIGAEWDGEGISGIASNASIMAVRHNDTLSGLLECFDYVSRACDAGVDVRVTNNSWGLGQMASRSIDLAVTELGQKGVMSVFGSGNSATDNDSASATVSMLSDNPYVVVVDAVEPSGQMAAYSQYGETTTDVMAPGSTILSTWGTDAQVYLGEADGDAVLYESFDEKTHSNLGDEAESDDDGVVSAQGEQLIFQRYDGTQIGGVEEGIAFDGDAAYVVPYSGDAANPYLSIITSPIDLSGATEKPRYLSLRYSFRNASEQCLGIVGGVAVKLDPNKSPGKGYTWAQLSISTDTNAVEWQGKYCDLGGTALAVTASGEQETIQLTADMIDWDDFRLQLTCVAVGFSMTGGIGATSAPVPCDIAIDSIALGNDLVPYQYDQGTSMASPAVAGAAAAIAGTGAAVVEGDAAKSAEKLAALVRGAAQPDERYDGLCSTGGYATVDGADDPGPAITKVIDDGDNVKIQGYFMSEAACVQLDGMEAQVVSCVDLGDGKAEITAAKPDSFAGGQVVVRVSENGKQSNQKADLGLAAGTEYYEQINLPVPDDLNEWGAWQLVGYAGDLFCLPRTSLADMEVTHTHLLRYDPESGTWASVDFPDADELAQAGLGGIVDASAATYDGSLVMLLGDGSGKSALFAYSEARVAQGENPWIQMGFSFELSDSAPFASTLASDGEDLYLFGGFVGDLESQQSDSGGIFRIDLEQNQLEPVGMLTVGRIRPQVSFGNGAFVVSGGISAAGTVQMGGITGADLVTRAVTDEAEEDASEGGASGMRAGAASGTDAETMVGLQTPFELQASPLDLSSFSAQTGQLSYASGAVTDGFMIVGAVNESSTADTYELSLSTGALSTYDKRASQQALLAPGATAYNGWFYVLAASQNEPYRVFSATEVETATQPGDYVAPDPDPDPGTDSDQKDDGSVGDLPGGLASTGDLPMGSVMMLCVAVLAAGAAVMAALRRGSTADDGDRGKGVFS